MLLFCCFCSLFAVACFVVCWGTSLAKRSFLGYVGCCVVVFVVVFVRPNFSNFNVMFPKSVYFSSKICVTFQNSIWFLTNKKRNFFNTTRNPRNYVLFGDKVGKPTRVLPLAGCAGLQSITYVFGPVLVSLNVLMRINMLCRSRVNYAAYTHFSKISYTWIIYW